MTLGISHRQSMNVNINWLSHTTLSIPQDYLLFLGRADQSFHKCWKNIPHPTFPSTLAGTMALPIPHSPNYSGNQKQCHPSFPTSCATCWKLFSGLVHANWLELESRLLGVASFQVVMAACFSRIRSGLILLFSVWPYANNLPSASMSIKVTQHMCKFCS